MSPSNAGWRAGLASRSASRTQAPPCARNTQTGRSSSTASLSISHVPTTRRRGSTRHASGRPSATAPCGANFRVDGRFSALQISAGFARRRGNVQTAPQPIVATWLKGRLPFFYGWVILACLCCCGFARQGPAVATLSIFVEPMTSEFGWSRTALSGAVSLGGILAALTSPLIGPLLDRQGARMMLCVAVLLTGASTMLLSGIESILGFYLLFCIARMNFAGPFDIGIYGAVNSWFLARRAIVNAIIGLAQMVGLVLMPLIAHVAMRATGWRAGWLAVGSSVLLIGLLPAWLVLVRRPEDLGLLPDGGPPSPGAAGTKTGPTPPEPQFSRAEALRTPAFWLLSLYTVGV